jgi:hypothetical protein
MAQMIAFCSSSGHCGLPRRGLRRGRQRASRLLKNYVFRQAAGGTGMYRHFRRLQAIENGSHSKTTFFEWRS